MVDSFAAVAFPRWNFQFYCLSALKQGVIPTGKYDVHVRTLPMNSLGLSPELISFWLFPFFSFFYDNVFVIGCIWKEKKRNSNNDRTKTSTFFFQSTKSYWYFDGCKVSFMLGVRVLALFFLIITINFYKHISKLFLWTMRYRKQSVDRSKSFKTLKGAPGRRFKSDASKAF